MDMGLSSFPAVVLLVENDPLVRYGYSVLIGDWGYTVVAYASTGEAAEAVASTGRSIGALVLGHDSVMAENGLAAAALLAQAAGGIPVAIIAGRLQRKVLDRAAVFRFTLLPETAEPERLRDWLRSRLTRLAVMDQIGSVPAD